MEIYSLIRANIKRCHRAGGLSCDGVPRPGEMEKLLLTEHWCTWLAGRPRHASQSPLVTERFLRLSAAPGATLATPGLTTTPALSAMPSLLPVDGDSCYPLLQSCLLLHCGWPDTTVFLLFLASQITSANLASSIGASCWNWMATRSLRYPGSR